MLYALVGLAAGVLAGMFGIGGGLIIVPSLMLMGGMLAQKATGTSLAALLLPVGILGVWKYWQNGMVDVRVALWVALGLLVGAWLGANVALALSARWLQRGFAIFLVLVAVQVWRSA
jgi:uncharacterized membrane protein YfcA